MSQQGRQFLVEVVQLALPGEIPERHVDEAFGDFER